MLYVIISLSFPILFYFKCLSYGCRFDALMSLYCTWCLLGVPFISFMLIAFQCGAVLVHSITNNSQLRYIISGDIEFR